MGEGRDGSPHPRGHGRGMGSRPRLHGGQALGRDGNNGGGGIRGWVPASARTREGEWVPALVFTGGRLSVGTTEAGAGMGPRIREDTGGGFPVFTGGRLWREQRRRGLGDGSPHPRGHGRGGVPHVSGVGSPWEQRSRGHGDGSPHPRGHGRGDGFPPSSSRGVGSSWEQRRRGGMGMGPRIREDTGGCTPIPRLHEGRL